MVCRGRPREHPRLQRYKLAQEMDFKEHSMYATIEKLKIPSRKLWKQFGPSLGALDE